jgi:hypothetical protein
MNIEHSNPITAMTKGAKAPARQDQASKGSHAFNSHAQPKSKETKAKVSKIHGR